MDLLNILIQESGLFEDAVQSSRGKIITGFPGNGHPPRLTGMFVLAMASRLSPGTIHSSL
jgi:hypothetical protein